MRVTIQEYWDLLVDYLRPQRGWVVGLSVLLFANIALQLINPLIMREIADIIEMDISTVSRVANGKYVQTDYGVFELKYFFNEKIETDDGEEISTRKVKTRINEMVEEESSQKPLSDEKISQILNEEGFPVARRTVAKYREQLSIPVARLRKRLE